MTFAEGQTEAINVICEDRKNPNLLFVGTDFGLHASGEYRVVLSVGGREYTQTALVMGRGSRRSLTAA